MTDDIAYRLDDQIGFVLRRATQRHLALFAAAIPDVTTTQFAVMARLDQTGPLSQNHLGRETAMDAATIKGVVDRLMKLGLVATSSVPDDKRRLNVALTPAGSELFAHLVAKAHEVSAETLAPLTPDEARLLQALLLRIT